MKHIVVVDVADVADGGADDRLVIQLRAGRDLAGDDDQVGLHERLARHAAARVLREAGVQHAVGNEIGNLVRMPLAHGLGGKNKGFGHKFWETKALSAMARKF